MLLLVCCSPVLHCGKGMRCMGEEGGLRRWLVSQSFWVFQVGGGKGAESTEGPGREEEVVCLMFSDHRCLRSALYMAKPSTAKTVAPTLALSQKVEFFRSVWAMCLRGGEEESGWGKQHLILTPLLKPQRDELPNDKTKSCALSLSLSPVETSSNKERKMTNISALRYQLETGTHAFSWQLVLVWKRRQRKGVGLWEAAALIHTGRQELEKYIYI